MNEGIDCGMRLLPLPEGLEVEVEARFNLALANLGYLGGPHECFVAALRATELFRSLGDTFRLIDCLIWTVMVGAHLGESQQRATELAEADALIDDDAPARQKAALALAHARHFAYLRDYENARRWAERQAAIYRQSGLEMGEQMALATAAWYGCALGQIDEAITILQRAIATFHRLNAPYGIGGAQLFLANAHALRGDREEALTLSRAVIPYLQRTWMVAPLVPYIALLHAQQPGSETQCRHVDRIFRCRDAAYKAPRAAFRYGHSRSGHDARASGARNRARAAVCRSGCSIDGRTGDRAHVRGCRHCDHCRVRTT